LQVERTRDSSRRPPGAEFVGGAASLFGGEGDALAELERSGAVI